MKTKKYIVYIYIDGDATECSPVVVCTNKKDALRKAKRRIKFKVVEHKEGVQ